MPPSSGPSMGEKSTIEVMGAPWHKDASAGKQGESAGNKGGPVDGWTVEVMGERLRLGRTEACDGGERDDGDDDDGAGTRMLCLLSWLWLWLWLCL